MKSHNVWYISKAKDYSDFASNCILWQGYQLNIKEPLTVLFGTQPNFTIWAFSFRYAVNSHIHKLKLS